MRKLNQLGDTIIEVLVATTTLALVLSVAFVSANRSLQQGTNAASRNQAVAYAEQQVELLRQASNNGTLNTFMVGQPFCIDPASGSKITSIDSNSVCHLASQDPYGVGISYNSVNQTFTVAVKWVGPTTSSDFSRANNDTLNQVVIYYQDPQ